MKTESIKEEEFTKIWDVALIYCCRPNCEVTAWVLTLFYVALLCSYQWEYLPLKSPMRTVRNEFQLLILSNESCKLSPNSSKESKDWLDDWYKEMKLSSIICSYLAHFPASIDKTFP